MEDPEVKAAVSTPTREPKEEHVEPTDFQRYFQVWDEQDRDVTKYAPPVLKAFWEESFELIEMCIRDNEEHPNDCVERANYTLCGVLDKMANYYSALVNAEAQVARMRGM